MNIKRVGEYNKEGRSNIHKIHLRGPNSFVLLLVSTRTTAAVCVFRMDDGASDGAQWFKPKTAPDSH